MRDGTPAERLVDVDESRGDPENPVVAMQMELQTVIDRYPEIQRQAPGYLAALLLEYADTLRQRHNLEYEVMHQGADVWTVDFGGMSGWVGAPRSGTYSDIDEPALREMIDADQEGDADE